MHSTTQTNDAVIAIWREPFKLGSPNVERWPSGLSVFDIVQRMDCLPDNFHDVGVVAVNGEIVPQTMWPFVKPRANTAERPVAVTFQVRVQGSGRGAGGGGKQVIRIVAALALTIATAGIAGGALGSASLLGSGFAAGTMGATLLAAGVSLVGSLILNGLSSTPARASAASREDSENGGASLDAAAVSGNVLQPNSPVPRVIGTRRIFPPFAFEPVTEIIGQDEFVDAVYCLAGPHKIEDVRLGNSTVSPDELDADIDIEISDGRAGSTVPNYPDRYGRTFPMGIELSTHGTSPDNLGRFQPPLPVYHAMSTADDPDEVWIHLLSQGMIKQIGGSLETIRIPFRIRMRLRGSSTWRYLPEIHYMDKTQSQRRLQLKIKFGSAYTDGLPAPSSVRGFVEARRFSPGQTIPPAGPDFYCDNYFNSGSGTEYYRYDTAATTRLRNITLEPDVVTVYLDSAQWPGGIYDIEIKRGATILNSGYTSGSYLYDGLRWDFFGSTSTLTLPMSRAELMDRIDLTRIVSIKNERPIDQKNLTLIWLRVRNRTVANMSVLASSYVNDYTSASDLAWIVRTTPAPQGAFVSVCWSPDLKIFCAVANNGTGTNRVMTSPDGINWTMRQAAAASSWYSVAWSPQLGLFCAVATNGSGTVIMTSPDGITWTGQTAPAYNGWIGVVWADTLGLFVAVGLSNSGQRAMTSPNGISWTLRTTPADNNWFTVCWSKRLGMLVAVANTGSANRIMTSYNGITWTLRTTPDLAWQSVCYSEELGRFVAVGPSCAMYSNNGGTWVNVPMLSNSWRNVCWSPELGIFLAIASTGSNNLVATSPDGINWTIGVTPNSDQYWGVCWCRELEMFVATSLTGTYRAMSRVGRDVGWTNLITTSNPAPHYRDILSGPLNFDPLPNALHDEAALLAWRAACITNNYTCDLVVEGMGVFDLLRIVASCGYARPYQSEIWGVIRDYNRSGDVPVQIFNSRNISGFKWRKAFTRMPSGFRVNFKDDNYEYTGKQIVVYRDGGDDNDGLTEQITYDGLVSRDKVTARAKFDLRQGQYRSTIYTFEASVDAIVCRRGSLIAVNHDLLLRAYGGARINGIVYNSAGNITAIEVDSPITVLSIADVIANPNINSQDNILDMGMFTGICIRRTNGMSSVHAISNMLGETSTLTLVTPISNPAGPGNYRQIDLGCLISIGVAGSEYKRMIVTDISNARDFNATITAVDEANEIWG